MTGKALKRIKNTAIYNAEHHRLARVKDIFFLLGGKKYDEQFYQILQLLSSFNCSTDLSIFTNENKLTVKELTTTLNKAYLNVLNNKDISLKQIKKLRHAYYELATADNFNLNALIADPDKVFDARIIAHRTKKYGQDIEVVNGQIRNPRNAPKPKLSQKWYKQISDELNLKDEKDNNLYNLPGYIQQLQQHVVSKSAELDSKKLKRIRYALMQICHEHKVRQDLITIDNLIKEKENAESQFTTYPIRYDRVRNVLLAVKESPITTNLRNRVSGITRLAWDASKDQDVFNIVNHMANLGLHYELMGLINVFLNIEIKKTDDQDAHRLALKKFIDMLYGVFNTLSVRGDISDADLKKLKKLIHTFAEKNDFDKKIFNLRRLYQKHHDDEEVAKKLRENAQRKYAYIDKLANEITQKKLNTRKKKKVLYGITVGVTTLIALGEGLVAAVFFGWLLIPSILIFGTAGFAVSYFLFKDDCYSTLKEYFIDGIFKNEKGQDISLAKKIAITGTILFTTAGASIFAIFAFSSTMVAVTGLLGAFSIVFPPAAFALAALVAVALVVSFSLVFYRVMADFIKNDRIKQLGNYLKSTFIDVWKKPENWVEMTSGQKFGHYAKVTAGVLFRGLVAAGTLALCTILTVASVGLAHTQAVSFMKGIPVFTAKMIDWISKIGIYALATPINSFFYAQGILKTTHRIQEGLVSLANKVMHPKDTWQSIKTGWEAFKTNKLRSTNLVISTLQRGFLYACTVLNAMGNAGGINNPESIDSLKKMGFSESGAKEVGAAALGGASLELNANAVTTATQPPEVSEQEMDNFVNTKGAKGKDEHVEILDEERAPLLPKANIDKLSPGMRAGLNFFNELRSSANDKEISGQLTAEKVQDLASNVEDSTLRGILSL